jgi:Putative peptidoglycan binding domain
MRTLITCAAGLAMTALAWGFQAPKPATATPATKKKAAVKKAPAKTAARKPAGAATASATVRTASLKKPATKKGAPVKRTTWRNRQASPSSDRYREIQNALVAKGYLPAESATGTWDQASADALKKFQATQNLDSNGKINSLSLIALGLGPRHDSAAPKTADGGNFLPESPDR